MRPVVRSAGGRRGRRLLLVTASLILGVLGLGTVEATAATPSSLAGESLTSQDVSGSTLTGGCTGNGNEGSFNFSVSGTATGPFPGTFTESGSFTTPRSGVLSDFQLVHYHQHRGHGNRQQTPCRGYQHSVMHLL